MAITQCGLQAEAVLESSRERVIFFQISLRLKG
jgi:hypothetical protein